MIEHGYTAAELLVYVDNVRGVRLFERLGWTKIGDPAPHPRNGRVEQRYSFSVVSRATGRETFGRGLGDQPQCV